MIEAIAQQEISLARVRAEFDQWRSSGSGRGRIPDRLWRLAVALLDSFPTSIVCKELRLSPGDLRKRRRVVDAALEHAAPSMPAFVELRAVDLARDSRLSSPPTLAASAGSVRAVLERGDGSRLTLDLPSDAGASIDALVTAFLRR